VPYSEHSFGVEHDKLDRFLVGLMVQALVILTFIITFAKFYYHIKTITKPNQTTGQESVKHIALITHR